MKGKKNYSWKFFKSYLIVSLYLPEFINSIISRIIITLILPFFKKKYAVAMLNILLCFKKAISQRQQDSLLKQSLLFSMFSARQVYLFLHHKKALLAKKISIQNKHILDEVIKTNGKALIVSGHFGVFPLIPLYLAHNNYKISVIIKPPHNEKFKTFIFDQMKKNNIGIIPTSPEIECYKKIHEALTSNHLVMFMIDQTPTRHQAHTYVKFFEWNTLVYPTIAEMAKKHNLPILPVFSYSKASQDSRPHTIVCYDPLNVNESQQALEETNKILEELILQYPWQWWWFHKKWYNLIDYNNPLFYKYARQEPSKFFAHLLEKDLSE